MPLGISLVGGSSSSRHPIGRDISRVLACEVAQPFPQQRSRSVRTTQAFGHPLHRSAKDVFNITAPAAKRASKQDTVIAMLRQQNGASIAEICKATGWLPHSARGFMSGALKKRL